jgi:mono/diheme cytochrome c family protein
LYKLHCTTCHGPDGKAQIDVIADATDLTEPDLYRNGSTPEDMHRSIEQGAGVAMPAWGPQLRNPDDLWHLVNFVRSLWPADRQAQ